MPFTLGYGTNGFTDHPLEVTLDVLESEGYGAVALTLGFPHLDPFAEGWRESVDTLRARLDARRDGAGMRVVVETGTRFLLDPYRKHRPTLVDDEATTRLRFMERAVEIAAALDAECVSFFSGVLPAGASEADGWARLRDRLPGLVAHARSHGVRLSLEPEPGMLVETVADALRLRDEIGGPPELGVTVDVGHCLVVEPDGVVGALHAAGPHLANVQLDDMPPTHHEHRPFGEGEIDLPLVLATLADVGYTGVAAVELPRHSYDAPGLAHRSMTALHTAWTDRDSKRDTLEAP
ncbi:sugar phosphate isomerase/epimerase [Cellulosimicrobium arenosum]|uniref:Sugar phosphate isomerase/epimerase n=2 Tax=Cellulosimicrobium arenosum TaxID=2708133 RepID=A0A927J0S9_9MICO|nr:sugar phosphate isomerase/epimerase family protein [Cellulosimicrobium arenosum]MBD8079799.1 sugar phosphate isomerase/epimerase [Cellulosimicrobium arenosum]